MGLTYFFDTYAMIEIFRGNPRYSEFQSGIGISTTKLNLMELHYSILKNEGKEIADEMFNTYLPFAIEYSNEMIKQANAFKLANKSKKLSYVDCIGYVLAKSLQIPFLTGDKEFKFAENVRFVQ